MPLPLIPVAIFGLAGGAWYAQRRRAARPIDPQVAAVRTAIFGQSLNMKLSADQLRKLAKVYRDNGHTAEARMLDLRVALKEAPKPLQDARQEAYRRGMASEDPAAIRNLANAFESIGATGAADNLREYAGAVEQNQLDSTTQQQGGE